MLCKICSHSQGCVGKKKKASFIFFQSPDLGVLVACSRCIKAVTYSGRSKSGGFFLSLLEVLRTRTKFVLAGIFHPSQETSREINGYFFA